MAFQPIVDVSSQAVFAYEALVRGPRGEGASSVLEMIDDTNRYAFDQQCRVKAIELADGLGIARKGALLSINFLPNAVYEPKACIKRTLETANRVSFPLDKLMFEFTENEALDTNHVCNIIAQYRSMGFKIALDDFGAGHAGLGLLTRIEPDVVKLDMELVRNLDSDARKRTIVKHTLAMLSDLGILTICEGVETAAELSVLRDFGVRYVQGYLLAKPAFQALPAVENISL
jgi:EAL domain-containing protein (putative c-di-GMP-specific phosphodiesterase class I)